MKPFILITFKFPPYAGVGGFRWSKFSKYLSLMGHNIEVLTVNWKTNDSNTFVDDVKQKNINITRIKSGYPHNLWHYNFKLRTLRLLKNICLKNLNRQFFYDDYAQQWGRYLLPQCEKLIEKKNINTIIATGHPFQSMRWAVELKKRIKHLKIILDFRDPWIHPYKKIHSNGAYKKIINWYKSSIELSDHCVFVTQGLASYTLDGKNKPFSIITNGHDVDIDDYIGVEKEKQLVYAGNIANGRDVIAKKFIDVIHKDPELLNGHAIKFYTAKSKKFFAKYENLLNKGLIQYCGTVSPDKIYLELSKSTAALQFNSEMFPYAVSTKIYENAATGTPTLSINGGGEIHELVEKNNWGISIRPKREEIVDALRRVIHEKYIIDREQANKYHYKSLGNKYSSLLNKM